MERYELFDYIYPSYSILKFYPNGTQISSIDAGWSETSINDILNIYKYVRKHKELFKIKECKVGFCGCK